VITIKNYSYFLPGENPWWLKNYKKSYKICLVVHSTVADRHQ